MRFKATTIVDCKLMSLSYLGVWSCLRFVFVFALSLPCLRFVFAFALPLAWSFSSNHYVGVKPIHQLCTLSSDDSFEAGIFRFKYFSKYVMLNADEMYFSI
jgi:hypothetical protein